MFLFWFISICLVSVSSSLVQAVQPTRNHVNISPISASHLHFRRTGSSTSSGLTTESDGHAIHTPHGHDGQLRHVDTSETQTLLYDNNDGISYIRTAEIFCCRGLLVVGSRGILLSHLTPLHLELPTIQRRLAEIGARNGQAYLLHPSRYDIKAINQVMLASGIRNLIHLPFVFHTPTEVGNHFQLCHYLQARFFNGHSSNLPITIHVETGLHTAYWNHLKVESPWDKAVSQWEAIISLNRGPNAHPVVIDATPLPRGGLEAWFGRL